MVMVIDPKLLSFFFPACFQEWPGCSEPPGHPTVPGVTVPLLFSPQPGLRDPLPGPVGVGIPLAAGRWIWERRRVQRRRWQAGRQAWAQHRQSGLTRQSWFFYSLSSFWSFRKVIFSCYRTRLACHRLLERSTELPITPLDLSPPDSMQRRQS